MILNSSMSDLTNAFQRESVAAIHMDLSSCYYDQIGHDGHAPTASAYPVVNQFASDLREVSVENIWVAYTGKWKHSLCGEFMQVGDAGALSSHQALHPSMKVRADEYLSEKDAQSAMPQDGSLLKNYLRSKNKDTLIIDGVKYGACFDETVISALSQNFRVFAPLDATNCSPLDYKLAPRLFALRSGVSNIENVTFTDTKNIMTTLRDSIAGSQPIAAYG